MIMYGFEHMIIHGMLNIDSITWETSSVDFSTETPVKVQKSVFVMMACPTGTLYSVLETEVKMKYSKKQK